MSELEEAPMLQKLLKKKSKWIQSSSVDDILNNKTFWKDIDDLYFRVMEHVVFTETMNSSDIVNQWLMLLKEMAEKDTNLKSRIENGTITKIYKDFMLNLECPYWFMKLVLYSLTDFELLEINDSMLSDFLNKVFQSNDFNVQNVFVHCIIYIFNNNLIYNTLQQKIQSKELLTLFTKILEEENEENIRAFLMKLNHEKTPVTIFSFLSSEIKMNRILIGKEIWVDINMLAEIITFSCKKCFLSMEGDNSSMEDEQDLVKFKICNISNLKFRAGKDDSEPAEMIMELSKPCTAFHEESVQFLENINTICFSIIENKDKVNDFIVNNFTSEMKITSPPVRPELTDDEDKSCDDPGEDLHSALVLTSPDCEQYNANYNSTIFKTPEERDDLNISVDESNRTGGSICYDSEGVDSNGPNNHNSFFLRTPEDRSTNISVAETQKEPETDLESMETTMKSESELPSSVPETPYSRLVVKTPEVINRTSFEVIDLISPVISSNTCEVIPNEQLRTEQTSPEEQNHPDAPVDAASEALDKVMNTSSGSGVTRKRKRQKRNSETEDDPNYSCASTQSGRRGPRRKMRRINDVDTDDEQSEYADTSFFSDLDSSKTEIKTRTRTVKKYKPFQYSELPTQSAKKSKTPPPVQKPTTEKIKKRRLTKNNSVDHLVEEPPSQVFSLALPSIGNHLSGSTLQPRPEERNMNKFDKVKYNIPSTQSRSVHRNISFFSSSGTSSQNCSADINFIDHEEIFPPEENVNRAVEPAGQSKSRLSSKVSSRKKPVATKRGRGRPPKGNKSTELAENPRPSPKKKNQEKAPPKQRGRRRSSVNSEGTSDNSIDLCNDCGDSRKDFPTKTTKAFKSICKTCAQSPSNKKARNKLSAQLLDLYKIFNK